MDRRPEIDRSEESPMDPPPDFMESDPTAKLDLGTAIIEEIGGDDATDEAELILTPSDDGDQGRRTFTQDREFKSQMRTVPSSEPLAKRVVPF
mmetsp:Transcript_31249/g.66305  ORF Transcript_31249/g.66305 Transcript_31249/m.66305 type:complete len:93 (-) Transcript_31249:434-712(-)